MEAFPPCSVPFEDQETSRGLSYEASWNDPPWSPWPILDGKWGKMGGGGRDTHQKTED